MRVYIKCMMTWYVSSDRNAILQLLYFFWPMLTPGKSRIISEVWATCAEDPVPPPPPRLN